MYDAVLRDSLSATLNIDIDDNRWTQASLPVRLGGLGVRSAVLLAPSACLFDFRRKHYGAHLQSTSGPLT